MATGTVNWWSPPKSAVLPGAPRALSAFPPLPLALIAGVLDEETDPNGNFTDVTLVSGTIQNDICASLA